MLRFSLSIPLALLVTSSPLLIAQNATPGGPAAPAATAPPSTSSTATASAANPTTVPPSTPADASITGSTAATAAAPGAVANAGPRPSTYTLQSGDTLATIAPQFGVTSHQLQKYNHLTNKQVRRMQIGQVIKIPPATPDAKSK